MTRVRVEVGKATGNVRTSSRRRAALFVLFILGAVFAANLNALSAGFAWDDAFLITENNLIRHWNTLPALLTQTFLASYYRPVVMLSFALEYALWGPRPFGFHLTNVLLHAANALLAFVILRRVSRNDTAALLGTLLFASHPAHKGVVVIADRTGMLSAFLFLASLAFYIGYRDSENRKRAWLRYGASVILCALALFSKEEALMLLPLIIMVDIFLFPQKLRESLRLSVLLYVPFLASTASYLLVRARVVEPMSAMGQLFAVEPVRRLLTIPGIMMDYMVLVVFPFGLDFSPRMPLAASASDLSTLLPAAAMLSLGAAVLWLFSRHKPALFGLLWFFIVFIPMSNIIPIFPEIADTELFTPIHFLYLPSIGMFLCAGCGISGMLDRFGAGGIGHLHRRGTVFCVLCIVLAFCLLSLRRNTIWKDDLRLFGHIVRMHPDRADMRHNLGNAYSGAGRMEEALEEFERAVALDPESAELRNGLGVVCLKMGSFEQAIQEFQESIRLDREYVGSYSNLAVAYAQQGMLPEAEAAGRTAVALVPWDPKTHTNLGLIYMRGGKLGRARKEFQIALDNDPDYADAHNAMGALYAKRGEYAKARWHWEEALRIEPGHREARKNLNDFRRMGR
jgi:Flp pilus assembly protein TadD